MCHAAAKFAFKKKKAKMCGKKEKCLKCVIKRENREEKQEKN